MSPIPTLARRAARKACLLLVPALSLSAGCNLDVLTPTVVPPESTQGEAALPTLLAGAVGDFAVAYGGFDDNNAGEGIILHGGLFADEFIATDYFETHRETDQRKQLESNASNSAVTLHLMQALQSAERTAAAYAAFPARLASAERARALNLAGMIYTIVAEHYCSGFPISTLSPSGQPEYGPSRTTQEILALGIARFDAAIAAATSAGSATQLNVARVGKGRALLDAGQYAAAAAAVAAVPTAFSFATEQGTVDDRTKNGIFVLTYISPRYTTADGEGGSGQPFVSAEDPRVPTEHLGTSDFDGSTELFAPARYGAYEATIPIATGIEARLIEAEAQLRAGSFAASLTTLNDLRAAYGLDPLLPAATTDARVDQLFAERAFWLFGTAHRLGDLRRLITQYTRPANSVFPTGQYFKGGTYGAQVNLIVPQEEGQDNPNYNPESCDPERA